MPKQKVGKYLGRIYRFNSSTNDYVMKEYGFKETLLDMISFELVNAGFMNVNGRYWNGECFVDLNKLEVYNDKGNECVVQINDGFLCTWSLKKLLKVEVKGREDADYFAKVLRLSGLKVSPDIFVQLFSIATLEKSK